MPLEWKYSNYVTIYEMKGITGYSRSSNRVQSVFAPYLVAALLASTHIGLLQAEDFSPRQVVRPFPPIKNPNIVAAGQSDPWVRDDELVLGVQIGKEARAYPINMLTSPSREIINDRLGERAIAATW